MVNYRNHNYNNKFFRRINNLLEKKINNIFLYNYNLTNYPTYNLHWGQVKLLYSELECLVNLSREMKLSDLLVVYIGAAPGDHTPLLLDLFPDINMLLYDPRNFNKLLVNHKRVIIKTGKDGWFTDDKVDEVIKIANGRKILYISDIRRVVDEKEILIDITNQQNWGILMKADFMLLKLRMPYLDKSNYDLLAYDMTKINNYVNIDYSNKTNDAILYLDGKIYTQLYAKVQSTETRLFVRKGMDGKYNLKHYSINNYDKILSYFNIYLRPKSYLYKNSDDAKNHILGFDSSYDSVGEYYLIYKYFKYYKKDKISDIHKNTILLINDLYTRFNRESGKNLITLHIKEYFYELNNISKSLQENPNTVHIDNITNFLRDVSYIILNLPSIYKKQFKNVSKSNILSKSKILEQIKSFETGSNNMIKIKDKKLTITDTFTKLLDSIIDLTIKIHEN